MNRSLLLVAAAAALLLSATQCGPERAKPATVSGTWHGTVLQHPLGGSRDLKFEAEMILSETGGRVSGTRRIAAFGKFYGSGDIVEPVSGIYDSATGVLKLNGDDTYDFKSGTYEYWFEHQDGAVVMRAEYHQETVGSASGQSVVEAFGRR